MARSQLTAPTFSFSLPQLSRALTGFAQTAQIWRTRSAGRRALKGLDAHLIADVGLTHREINQEAAKRFWQA
ncbi:DUF1127 domain-containing protein [Gemmobacter serpentinus]|uniref:DUF1127 domain-containing protein n=1 Tax=Gemmobacter serpentinus TaxID=2652247 RepID=UPI00124E5AA5|nr:DUF1127 domain-containing protein [Gemmobacter serpentinus]